MSRNTIRISAPAPSTYHLACQLQARAIDTLYKLTEGHRTMDPIDAHIITAALIVHPWGCSAELRAVDSTGHLAAAAEATAIYPLPSTIRSRIRSYQSGTLTWNNTAAPITSAGADPAPHITFEAAGRHHYHVRREINPDTYREHWDLTIDGQPCPHRFADPVGAADFIHTDFGSRR